MKWIENERNDRDYQISKGNYGMSGKGRPKKKWEDVVQSDMWWTGVNEENVRDRVKLMYRTQAEKINLTFYG